MKATAPLKFTYLVMAVYAIGVYFVDANNISNDNGDKLRVPVINLATWLEQPKNKTYPFLLTQEQRNIVLLIRKACKEVGFFQITGVVDSNNDKDLIERTWKSSREFFALPMKEKMRHKTKDAMKYPYGYERTEILTKGKMLDNKDDSDNDDTSASSQQVADLKETFAVGPSENNSGMPPRQWIESPNLSEDFRNSLEEYYRRMEDLALTVLEIFAFALEESPSFFENKMERHMSALRLVHYYPLKRPPTKSKSKQQQLKSQEPFRLIRAGAHTDYGALTILATRDQGLEVLLKDNDDGDDNDNKNVDGKKKQRWLPIPFVSGAFVVNLGDLMQRWTNDEWISTMHRVVMPSTEAQERRYSMAYFVNINGDTPIEPLKCCRSNENNDRTKYQVITAGEHLMAKHLASMGIADDKDETISTMNGEL